MKAFFNKINQLARTKDFLAKTICLVLAVILWALLSSSKTETLRFKIPIILKNLPADMTVSEMPVRFATVLFEGKNEDLKSPSLKSVKAIVNLVNAVPDGPRLYPVELEKLEIPDEIVVTSVTKEVMVRVEPREVKWVAVLPVISGRVKTGKIIIDKIVQPERVRITGPRSIIDEIQSVETEDVAVDDEAAGFERQVGLKKEDRWRDITFSDTIFIVKVIVADSKDTSVVTAAVKIRNAAKGFGYELKEASVEVYVRSKANRIVTSHDIDAFIDVGDLNPNRIFMDKKPVEAWRELPVNLVGKDALAADIVSFSPKKIWIKIMRK